MGTFNDDIKKKGLKVFDKIIRIGKKPQFFFYDPFDKDRKAAGSGNHQEGYDPVCKPTLGKPSRQEKEKEKK